MLTLSIDELEATFLDTLEKTIFGKPEDGATLFAVESLGGCHWAEIFDSKYEEVYISLTYESSGSGSSIALKEARTGFAKLS
jgi:hypothetical protein